MPTARDVWSDEDSYALTLITLFIEEYVIPWAKAKEEGNTEEENPLNWDPETICLEIEDDHNISLPKLVHDRLMTAINLLTTDSFFKSCPDFIAYCNVLAGTPYGPEFDPADSVEVAWGITEAMLISPPDDNDEEPFTDEIRAYIGQALDDEGIMNAPDILQIALRDAKLTDVQGEFSDDPTMFNAIYDAESSKTDDINRAIRQNLRQLLAQLRELPLQDGDTSKVEQMLQQLDQREKRDEQLL